MMTATAFLFATISLLFCWAYALTKDFLSPSCLVCESFILAFICALFSSHAGGWEFNVHTDTVFVIILGLISFLLGSFLAKVKKNNVNYREFRIERESIKPLEYSKVAMLVLLAIQCGIFVIFFFYWRRSNQQFSGLDWNAMMRMRRLTASYGEGLEIEIPGIINQGLKLAKANAYIALYYLTHNIAVYCINKKEKPRGIAIFSLIIFINLLFSILQSARYDILLMTIGGITIWYTFYQYYSSILCEKSRNMRRAIAILAIIVFGMACLSSVLGTFVGRATSDTILSEAYNYFGRTIQAFDVYLSNNTASSHQPETFFGIYKFLNQIGVIDIPNFKIHLEFAGLDGNSLGNTYTVFRPYFNDFGIIGVVILPFIEGWVMSILYRIIKRPKIKELNMVLIIYSMIIPSSFFYGYSGFFFSTILSINYLIIITLTYIIAAILSKRIYVDRDLKLTIKKRNG